LSVIADQYKPQVGPGMKGLTYFVDAPEVDSILPPPEVRVSPGPDEILRALRYVVPARRLRSEERDGTCPWALQGAHPMLFDLPALKIRLSKSIGTDSEVGLQSHATAVRAFARPPAPVGIEMDRIQPAKAMDSMDLREELVL
jgi:hypothetical protein